MNNNNLSPNLFFEKDGIIQITDNNLEKKPSSILDNIIQKNIVPPLDQAKHNRLSKRKESKNKQVLSKWHNFISHPLTVENENDLRLIGLRSYLDPSHHFKRQTHKNEKFIPKDFQIGTVIECKSEFYSSRIPHKQRKRTLVDEVLSHEKSRKYLKRKFLEVQEKSQQNKGKSRLKQKVPGKRRVHHTRKP